MLDHGGNLQERMRITVVRITHEDIVSRMRRLLISICLTRFILTSSLMIEGDRCCRRVVEEDVVRVPSRTEDTQTTISLIPNITGWSFFVSASMSSEAESMPHIMVHFFHSRGAFHIAL